MGDKQDVTVFFSLYIFPMLIKEIEAFSLTVILTMNFWTDCLLSPSFTS